MRLIADAETNGFLNELDTIHCVVLKDIDTGEVTRGNVRDKSLPKVLEMMDAAELIVGHNLIEFDIPAIQKVYPGFSVPVHKVYDTLVAARLIYPDLFDIDMKLIKQGKLPGQFLKRHSLAAWGHRLGVHKGDFKGPWDEWTPEMEDYCEQDTEVTLALFNKLASKNYDPRAVQLEHRVAHIIARQVRYGIGFDKEAAVYLYANLTAKRLELEAGLHDVFKPRYLNQGAPMKPKHDNKRTGYVEGAPVQKVVLTEFNPGSRDHIAMWLTRMYGWKPADFTNDGKPKVDETVLAGLTYPAALPLQSYMVVLKRLGQLAEGKEAWLRHEKNGRIHGSVITNGAVTGRMTHSRPNMGQVPACYSPYGTECRSLFVAAPGKVLIGADAEALELRDLAGYMSKFDGGAYISTVLLGNKALGTDIHSVNARALGLDPKRVYFEGETGRDLAKTWFYAFIYGAGNEKLGFILTRRKGAPANKAGAAARKSFLKELPALAALIKRIKDTVKQRGSLRGLDGRVLHIRSQHAAPNTLLQSAGAVQMKMALVLLDDELQARGLVPGVNYEFVANVHDEWQIEADEDKGELIGQIAIDAIRRAGEALEFPCALSGAYKIGRTWAETH